MINHGYRFTLSLTSFLLLIGLLFCSGYAQAKTLVFASEATYPPFEYVDQSGEVQGFDIDIAKALCTVMQAQCEFQNQPWNSLIPGLKLGKFDALITSMTITPQRAKQVDFTNPYYFDSASFVAPVDEDLTISSAGLKNKTIGVQAGTVLQQYLKATYGREIKVNTYSTIQEALLDLQAGRINAVLGDTHIMNNWLQQQSANKFTRVGEPITDAAYFGQGYGIAVRKGNTELLEQLNAALATIKENGTYQQIQNKYFAP